MSKIFAIFLMFFLLLSCEKQEEYTSTVLVVVVNESPNGLVYSYKATFGSDKKFISSGESDTIRHTQKQIVEESLTGIDIYKLFPVEIISKESFFDITDTLSFEFELLEATNRYRDSLYFAYIEKQTQTSGYQDRIIETVIRYGSDFDELMQKDYTMLEKFPEYYQKQE